MFVLFIRAIIIYFLVFAVMRLTGKRQVSELQPFDFVITLLIADLASQPVSDTSIPLLYGVVPIVALFLLQKALAFLTMKFEKLREVMCGKPLIVIEKGRLNECYLRETRYTINDLLEQLRKKDVFTLADVEYAILETDGDLSVLLKGEKQNPTYTDMKLEAPVAEPGNMLIIDGRRVNNAFEKAGIDGGLFVKRITQKTSCKREEDVFFAMIDPGGSVLVQEKAKKGGKIHHFELKELTA